MIKPIRILGIIKLICYKTYLRERLNFKLKCNLKPSLIIRVSNSGSIQLKQGIEIRDNVVLNVSNHGKLVLGENVFINDGCAINCRNEVIISEGTIIGQNVLIYDHDHDYKSGPISKRTEFITEKIYIGKNVWIGSGVIILKGVTIGDNAVIGAGLVLNKDVKSGELVYAKQEIVRREILYE